jgi:hypothetical protein
MAEPGTADPDGQEAGPAGPPGQSAGAPPAADAPADSVADALRRLHDAAAAHDED